MLAPHARVEHFSHLGFTTPVSASGFPLAVLFGPVCTMLKLSFLINVMLAFFNLIPIPPLDGSWVLQYSFPLTLGRLYDSIRPYSFLIFLALIYSGIVSYLIFPALVALVPGFWLLDACTMF